jgi:predicted transcriptional regulator
VVRSKLTSLIDGPDILEVLAAVSDRYSFKIKALKSADMHYDFHSMMEELRLSKRQLSTKIAHLSRVGIVRRNKRVYHLTSFGKVIISSLSLVESNVRVHSKLKLIDAIVSPKELTWK